MPWREGGALGTLVMWLDTFMKLLGDKLTWGRILVVLSNFGGGVSSMVTVLKMVILNIVVGCIGNDG